MICDMIILFLYDSKGDKNVCFECVLRLRVLHLRVLIVIVIVVVMLTRRYMA